MAKISGTLIVSSAPRLSKPSRLSSQPHWKIATRTPKAAPIESRFISTAFSGSTSERSITIRTRKLSARTKPTIFQNEPEIWRRTSSVRAVSPPTSTRRHRGQGAGRDEASRAGGRPGPWRRRSRWRRSRSPRSGRCRRRRRAAATALTPGCSRSSAANPATAAAIGGSGEGGDDLDRVGAAAELRGGEFVADPHVAVLGELLRARRCRSPARGPARRAGAGPRRSRSRRGTGRAMTRRAQRSQKPGPGGAGERRRRAAGGGRPCA